MTFRTLMMGAAFAFTATAVLAADSPPPSPPMLVRGVITAIDANSVTVKKADGTSVTAAILPATRFAAVEPRKLDQIKSTDFVGITSVPGPNDTMIAEEIHLIPVKGLGEGSYPWDHHPDGSAKAGSMTNGMVASAGPAKAGSMTNGTVSTNGNMSLKVAYRGAQMVNGKCVGLASMGGANPCTGVANVTVLPSTQIVAIVPAKATDAKAGLTVMANFATTPNGLVAGSLVMEKNGIKPPM